MRLFFAELLLCGEMIFGYFSRCSFCRDFSVFSTILSTLRLLLFCLKGWLAFCLPARVCVSVCSVVSVLNVLAITLLFAVHYLLPL